MVKPNEIDWSQLGFAIVPTAFMYVAHCKEGETWKGGKLEPFGNIQISPAAGVLNYGQGVFEGLKAYRTKSGDKIVLFRPEDNAARMEEGCRRLCIPPISKEMFMEGVIEVIKANKDYVPPYRPEVEAQASLYLRPLVWGTGPVLGVKPSPEYTFLVYASPVGPYFKEGFNPIKLYITKDYHRAVLGGTGGVKAIGNYAASLLPAKKAKEQGYSEVLYLDAQKNIYVEEVGSANFFCIKGKTLLAPELDGNILPGVTRRSVLQLAKERFGLKVEERKVKLQEVLKADEAFSSGTAVVIYPIGLIHYEGKDYIFNGGKMGTLTQQMHTMLLDIQHGVIPGPEGWVYPVC
jgi:branched-chain amino acid aminotransferase